MGALLPSQQLLTVACVNVGDYLGRGDEYVSKLQSMVSRNLTQSHRFECITESDKVGWWAKVDLFRPSRFSGRVLYVDLDTVITGPLDALAAVTGIVHLHDWGWTKNDYCSAVMVWDAGEHSEAFTQYDETVPQRFRGDQDWLTHLGGWKALPKGMNVSYRYEAKDSPPKGAITVSMHGRPKPHEITAGWVPQLWR